MRPTGVDGNGNLLYPEGVEPYVMRTSERANFKRCRRLWNYTSQNKRNLEPTRMNYHLAFGIAFHVGMEHYYEPERWTFPEEVKRATAVKAFIDEVKRQEKEEGKAKGGLDDERKQDYAERIELGIGMLNNYFEWAVDHDKFKPIAVEEKFQVIVPDENGEPLVVNGRPVVYQVRLDLLLEDEDERLWVLDHKTAGNFSDLAFLDVDTQITSYAWAAQLHYGRKVAGLVYNEVRKAVPHEPKELKNGTLSQDKRQLTTYNLYMKAIRDRGLDTAPYRGMLDYLSAQPEQFVRRTQVHRSQTELAVQQQLIADEARDMVGTPSLYPNPHKFNCNGCDFRPPCTIENERGDVEFVLSDPVMYRQRPTEDMEEYE